MGLRVTGRSIGAGVGGAALTALLLFVWDQVEHWVIRGSGFTDLPGQDSLGLMSNLSTIVLGLLALVAGRVVSLLSKTGRWLAAFIGVSPLLLLMVLAMGESNPLRIWYVYLVVYLLALLGAYGPSWTWKRSRPHETTRLT
jgi:hypothetical protein